MSVRERVAEAHRAFGATCDELGHAVGVSKATVARWLKAKGIDAPRNRKATTRLDREAVEKAVRIYQPCHIGRVGNLRRLAWAYECGADSVDSSFPLWSRKRLGSFLRRITFRGDARPESRPSLLTGGGR